MEQNCVTVTVSIVVIFKLHVVIVIVIVQSAGSCVASPRNDIDQRHSSRREVGNECQKL